MTRKMFTCFIIVFAFFSFVISANSSGVHIKFASPLPANDPSTLAYLFRLPIHELKKRKNWVTLLSWSGV